MKKIYAGLNVVDEDIKLAVRADEVRLWNGWEHRRDPLIFNDVYVLETGHNMYIIRTGADGERVVDSFWSRSLTRYELVNPVVWKE